MQVESIVFFSQSGKEEIEVTIFDLLAESKRELAMRKSFYSKKVRNGTMKPENAKRHFQRMEGIVFLLGLMQTGNYGNQQLSIFSKIK